MNDILVNSVGVTNTYVKDINYICCNGKLLQSYFFIPFHTSGWNRRLFTGNSYGVFNQI